MKNDDSLNKTIKIIEGFKLLTDSGAVSIDGGPLLTSWDIIDFNYITGDPDNEVVIFSWTDGDSEYSTVFTEGSFLNGAFDKSGNFCCEDSEGNPSTIRFFKLTPILTVYSQEIDHVPSSLNSVPINLNVFDELGNMVEGTTSKLTPLSKEQISDIIDHSSQLILTQRSGQKIGTVMAELEEALVVASVINKAPDVTSEKTKSKDKEKSKNKGYSM